MNGETVREILKKHFGTPRNSLTVGDCEEPEDRVSFYYVLPQEAQITALRDLLGMNHLVGGIKKLPELEQSISDKPDDANEYPQCVRFSEADGHWYAGFYKITGVTYHRTRGNKVAAALQRDVNPYIILSDCEDDFHGFWRKVRTKKRVPYNERPGLSYWMNKALKTNERFRGFAADFFLAAAEENDRYILKDAARTIKSCGCFLPPVSFQDLIRFRTPADLVRSFQDEETELSVDFNKVDLNVGYVMVSLAPRVDEKDWKVISKLDAGTVSSAVSLRIFYDGFSAEEFIRGYYLKKVAGQGSKSEVSSYVGDYLEMCGETGEKFRIGYTMNGLIRAHDELSVRIRMEANKKEIGKPLLTVPSKFDKLENAIKKTGSEEFERIRTTERLLFEGEYQHNCVFSRREMVRRDIASIYRWDHKGESYTIQFARNRSGGYSVTEVRARFNRSITKEHLEDLKKLLRGVASVDERVESELDIDGDEDPFPPFIIDDDQLELPF